jgi:peptide/nickel transport system substrate-binding protein
MRPIRRLLLVLPLVLAACGDGTGGAGGGTVIVGAAADADALVPGLTRGVQGRVVSEVLFDRIADIGPGLNTVSDTGFLPRLARSWSWSDDSLVLTLRFDRDARWHDGVPVTSADYAFALKLIRDPALASSLAADLADIDSIATPDDGTARVHFRRRDAEQFYAASLLVPLPKHAFDSIPVAQLRTHPIVRTPVGTGRFRLVSWEPDVRLEVAAVEDHYRGRPSLDRVIFAKSPDPASGLARIWAAETDVWEPLTPDMLPEAARHAHVRVVSGPGFDYGFLAFNFRAPDGRGPHPLFADRQLRRALTMAVDRDAILRTIFDTLGAVSRGPFVRAQRTADTTVAQIAFDRAAAAAALDSLGWRAGADGMRRRGGTPLRFSILIPTSSAVRVRAAALLQEQLKGVGVDVRVETLEFQAFLDRYQSRRFDTVIGGWRTTPSPRGIRATWGSPAIAGAAQQNAGSYVNTDFDAAVTAGLGALDLNERRAQLRRAYEIINDDAAAIFLYETRSAAAVHRRIILPPWRSDAWWMTLGDWRIDPAQRLPRDAAPTTP